MHELTIELGERSYAVRVGRGLLRERAAFADVLGTRSLIVTSTSVARLHLDTLRGALGGHRHGVHVVPDGDAAKTLAHVGAIADAAAAAGLSRDATIISLGGGAVGDVAGLAAALFHRGVGHVQVPTTLLSQVDSAVGGKTAINHSATKNLLGAFHQPRRVIADIDTLATLPVRELRSGLAEVAKYAIIEGGRAFDATEAAAARLALGDAAALEEVVVRCCAAKARIVARDEFDRGERALLNLGHTFGHALESVYAGRMLHGEAVALGCVLAARLSVSLGWLPARDAARISTLISALGLATALPEPAPAADAVLSAMARDKKVVADSLRLVLLRGIGRAEVTGDYPRAALELTVREAVSGKLP